jgi:hypothetical protein
MRKNMMHLAGCLLNFVAPSGAKAQIIYHDINPDKVVNFADYEINIGCSPDSCYYYPSQNVKVSLGSGGGWVYWQNEATIIVDAVGKAQALQFGQAIDANATWAANGQALLTNGVGNWASVTNKYLGVKILKGGQWYNGWVRMDIGANGTYGVVKDYAFNAQPNAPILAGQILTTGVDGVNRNSEVSVYLAGKGLKIVGLKDKAVCSITGMDGKLFMQKEVTDNSSVSLTGFTSGIYVVQLISVRDKKVFKVFLN